ncbi:MAG: hypothetical protein ACKOCE_06570 [Acidimicrobiia bacterium]
MSTMLPQILVATVVVVAVSSIALVLRSRRSVDAPTQREWMVPSQIDPADLGESHGGIPDEWSIVVFTSGSCHVCTDVVAKAEALRSRHVGVLEVEYSARGDLHAKYRIDAVPTLVLCDRLGVVRHSILGPVSATDLWAAVARVRDPGGAAHCDDH